MIVLFTGATKNVGDYLIGDRAKRLFREFVDTDIVEVSRFSNLEEHIEIINKAEFLVLCGGPAYAPDIYDGIYRLDKIYDKIKVPIVPFGLGWCGKPFNNSGAFRFNDVSNKFIKEIHSRIESSSCRDVITEEVLQNNGVKNVTMTGCPVWYDLDFINEPFQKKDQINKVVITTGARETLLLETIRIYGLVKKTFPKAKIYVTFHRGIYPWKEKVGITRGIAYTVMAIYARLLGMKVLDVSGDLSKLDFYKDCDFHIGYRVHAHLFFLSKRLPSMLINEDGRGVGMVKSMNLPVFNAHDSKLIANIKNYLEELKKERFGQFAKVGDFIDGRFETMKSFLKTLRK